MIHCNTVYITTEKKQTISAKPLLESASDNRYCSIMCRMLVPIWSWIRRDS